MAFANIRKMVAVVKSSSIPVKLIQSSRRAFVSRQEGLNKLRDIVPGDFSPLEVNKALNYPLHVNEPWFKLLPSTEVLTKDLQLYHAGSTFGTDGYMHSQHQTVAMENAASFVKNPFLLKIHYAMFPAFWGFLPKDHFLLEQLRVIDTFAKRSDFLLANSKALKESTYEILRKDEFLGDGTTLLIGDRAVSISEHKTIEYGPQGETMQHIKHQPLDADPQKGVEHQVYWPLGEHICVSMTLGAGTAQVDLINGIMGEQVRTVVPDMIQNYRDWCKERVNYHTLFDFTLHKQPALAAHLGLMSVFDVGRDHGHEENHHENNEKRRERMWGPYVDPWEGAEMGDTWSVSDARERRLWEEEVEYWEKELAKAKEEDLKAKKLPEDQAKLWEMLLPPDGWTVEKVKELYVDQNNLPASDSSKGGTLIDGLPYDATSGAIPGSASSIDLLQKNSSTIAANIDSSVAELTPALIPENLTEKVEQHAEKTVSMNEKKTGNGSIDVVETAIALSESGHARLNMNAVVTDIFNKVIYQVIDDLNTPNIQNPTKFIDLEPAVRSFFDDSIKSPMLGENGMVDINVKTRFINIASTYSGVATAMSALYGEYEKTSQLLVEAGALAAPGQSTGSSKAKLYEGHFAKQIGEMEQRMMTAWDYSNYLANQELMSKLKTHYDQWAGKTQTELHKMNAFELMGKVQKLKHGHKL